MGMLGNPVRRFRLWRLDVWVDWIARREHVANADIMEAERVLDDCAAARRAVHRKRLDIVNPIKRGRNLYR